MPDQPAKRILALPVDGRPVTREQVQLLAEVAGCELSCPAVEELGYFREPASRDHLAAWVSERAEAADGFIFSIDMLVYGGLVPSRFIDDSESSLLERLELLKQLKRGYPDRPLYAFCATMRLSNNNENEEEKLYWADYGELIWRWSYHSDRFDCLGNSEDRNWAEMARAMIPEQIRQDYLTTRARNFAVTCRVLELVEAGVIDRLILPQDDTAEYGFNIAERRKLQAMVDKRGLGERVLIYPGADEVIYTLLVHQLQHLGVIPPLKVALHPHQPDVIQTMVARYEDRTLLESIHCQIAAAGAALVPNTVAADAVIAVHTSGSQQGDWAMEQPLPDPVAADSDWLSSLKKNDKPLALLDLAYANGGDPQLIQALPRPLRSLTAYAGWNTASNSIGSLVAQLCVAVNGGSTENNRHLLAIRLLDDFLYQADFRQRLRRQVPEAAADPDRLLATLETLYLEEAREWLQEQGFDDIQVDSLYLPWRRSFEIGLRTRIGSSCEAEVNA
ncbi:hypothetical protein AUP74_01044 [Microbulbifer aggregans]|uniref:DUF4127 family protein n=1 Tax=Microbulbifer aggregans TaxID=1769779 RepID=A0A1C9W5R6_9GAMM|nr:DUF4127 family protein [Microbulbifer aggregans]AOS96509.1 hypothetical protein AUP74_01044 [Microbulbifer aggregans]